MLIAVGVFAKIFVVLRWVVSCFDHEPLALNVTIEVRQKVDKGVRLARGWRPRSDETFVYDFDVHVVAGVPNVDKFAEH